MVECEIHQEERDVFEDMGRIDECDLENFGKTR